MQPFKPMKKTLLIVKILLEYRRVVSAVLVLSQL